MKNTKPKANKGYLFAGILTFFLLFSSVYSFDRSCCGHQFKQDMSVADFVMGIPSCSSYNPWELLASSVKFTGLVLSILWMVIGLGGLKP